MSPYYSRLFSHFFRQATHGDFSRKKVFHYSNEVLIAILKSGKLIFLSFYEVEVENRENQLNRGKFPKTLIVFEDKFFGKNVLESRYNSFCLLEFLGEVRKNKACFIR